MDCIEVNSDQTNEKVNLVEIINILQNDINTFKRENTELKTKLTLNGNGTVSPEESMIRPNQIGYSPRRWESVIVKKHQT